MQWLESEVSLDFLSTMRADESLAFIRWLLCLGLLHLILEELGDVRSDDVRYPAEVTDLRIAFADLVCKGLTQYSHFLGNLCLIEAMPLDDFGNFHDVMCLDDVFGCKGSKKK